MTDKKTTRKTAKKASAGANSLTESGAELDQDVNFESALEELEALVAQMESGELSLDQSLQAFERGVALTRHCQSALKAAELKVQTLTSDGDLVDFDSGGLDGP